MGMVSTALATKLAGDGGVVIRWWPRPRDGGCHEAASSPSSVEDEDECARAWR